MACLYQPRNPADFFRKALRYAWQSGYACLLENNKQRAYSGPFPRMLALGAKAVYYPENTDFQDLEKLRQNRWLFGTLSYELKNAFLGMPSHNPLRCPLPDFLFFEPEHLITFEEANIIITSDSPDRLFCAINALPSPNGNHFRGSHKVFTETDRNAYLKNFADIHYHLRRGDIYEVNYCLDFFGDWNPQASPLDFFERLNAFSPMPFAALFRAGPYAVVSASPERFLRKHGTRLLSQPMKGTLPRNEDQEADEGPVATLKATTKERAENIMIVDLVRNDLSTVALPASVKVEELCGVYSYNYVHQMVSSIGARVCSQRPITEILASTFPMGSMSGAPKLSALRVIEQFEAAQRGWFSGSVGYISPDGDFDFNVVIRSLLLNLEERAFFFMAGSAVTHLSEPEKEYEECLLKARALKKTLGAD